MSIWNKVLIGFILVVSAVFSYMAVRTLKTHQYWRSQARAYEFFLDRYENMREACLDGGKLPAKYAEWDDFAKTQLNRVITTGQLDLKPLQERTVEMKDTPGIQRTQLELHKVLLDRGRVWYNCSPQRANPQTGQVSVTIELPSPHGIADKTVLHAFEEAEIEKGGRYIGEFKVTAVADKQLALEPTMKFSPRELERLAKSKGPWTLYDVMPADNHESFTSLTDQQRKAMLPEACLEEYARDGQPARADDPEQCKVDGKYVRPLQDYKVLMAEHFRQRSILIDLFEAGNRDKRSLEEAVADAKRQEEFYRKEIASLKAEVAELGRQRDVVAAHRKLLQQQLAAAQQLISQQIAANQVIAGEIAKIQLEASRQIDQRTNTMARANAGSEN